MKTKTFTTMGALHPILFFAGVYIVALVFSIFICSSLFYSCNSSASTSEVKNEKNQQQNVSLPKTEASIVLR